MSFITLSKLHGHGFDYQLMLHNTSQSPLDTRCLYSVHAEQVNDCPCPRASVKDTIHVPELVSMILSMYQS